ncbi:MAG: DNA-processing protein DprA [Hyphomicrobiales bacterium]|nr:DNA-processing protein DprA [Hyphomicrobiales bacterium]MDE2113998.1 DNA-processing protein DprA [Hyphomicrobiales bacterium]
MQDPTTKVRLTDDQRLDWLRLIRCDNVGPRTFRALLNRYGSAGAALEALPALSRNTGRPIRLFARDDALREMEEAAALDIRFIGLGEPDYPAILRNIDTPPPILAVRGNVTALSRVMIAIVGSRNASAAGLAFTERLARGIAQAGHVVVSGLARGIDVRAHIATQHTGTVAVLAGGHQRIYPSDHAGIIEQILEQGAAISEMPLHWEPRGRDFPRRNRIVSGLSHAVIVVEAARHSGSLITAKFAAEQGREVFAVPGSPLDPRAEGTNDLLREGASLCTRVEDVLQAIEPIMNREPQGEADLFAEPRNLFGNASEPLWDESDLLGDDPDLKAIPATVARMEMDEPEQAHATPATLRPQTHAPEPADTEVYARIVNLLSPAPISIDDLCRSANCSINILRQVLLDIELDGRLQRHGGNLVSYL